MSRTVPDSPAGPGGDEAGGLTAPAPTPDLAEQVLAVMGPVRRFVVARIDDRQDVDDVVQETLTRVLAAQGRLEDVSLTAYALTVARNLLATRHRDELVARTHAPKLIDLREPHRPEDSVLATEDRQALGAALSALPSERRDQLLEHVLGDRPLGELGDSAPSLAAQLGRTRAKLRVDYLLALRQVTPATPRCRPVLLAVSAGDQRRQKALRAGSHLLNCPTCSDLGEPLLQRRRALAGVVPWLPLGALHGHLERFVRQHPAPSAVGAITAAVAAVALLVGGVPGASTDAAPAVPEDAATTTAKGGAQPQGPSPSAKARAIPTSSPPAPAAADATSMSPRGPVLGGAETLQELVGESVTARAVQVLTVPADEGFWVRNGDERVWVQLPTRAGGESAVRIRPGQRLTFAATVVAHDAAFARTAGLTAREGAAELTEQGAHLTVTAGTLTVVGQ